MSNRKFGVCNCGMWGYAPIEFRENKHFLKCPHCNQLMYLNSIGTPDEYALRNSQEITPKVVNQ